MNFKERLAWLGRMPLKYKLLFGSQALFFTMAINMRLNRIDQARQFQELQETADEEKKGNESESK